VEVHHQHKPVRNWREFAKEVGIIVLGVVIALGGEQAVEAIHHHYQTSDLRAALDQELAWDLARMKDSVDQAPCVTRRLDELDRWSKSFARGRPLKIVGPIGEPAELIFRDSVWRSAAGTAIDYLPLDKRIAYAQFYASVELNSDMRNRMDDTWDDLSGFAALRALTPDQLVRISRDINYIRMQYPILVNDYAVWQSAYAPPLHITVEQAPRPAAAGKSLTAEERASFCKPLLAS
jgi:hypothetical protein